MRTVPKPNPEKKVKHEAPRAARQMNRILTRQELEHADGAESTHPFRKMSDRCITPAMKKTVQNTEALARINLKIVADGETLPAIKLKDGSTAQTGTVATMLHNLNLYNSGERGQVEEELRLAIPTLFKVGLFDLFKPEEWVNGCNPGRKFMGEAALRYLATK